MNFLRGLISFGLRRFILKNIMRSATYLEIVQGEISVHVERKYCCKMQTIYEGFINIHCNSLSGFHIYREI